MVLVPGLQTQPFLDANDAILDLERIGAQLEVS